MADNGAPYKKTLLFACSGGSNVGQIANDAVKALDQLGQGHMYCPVGVAGRLPSFVDTALKADKRVAIDGCEGQCLKQGFEAAGVPLDVHIVVTDLGIEKGHHFQHSREEVARVVAIVKDALGVRPYSDEASGAEQ